MHPSSPAARFVIAGFGELVADPSRVAMLLSLMDGLARPASELARIAGVAPSTASAHLQRLTVGGLVCVEPQGRHRYFRLASERVADALESIALQGKPGTRRPGTDAAHDALSMARTCYRHLAGRLGVAWLVGLERQRLVRMRHGAIALTAGGVDCFGAMGLVVPEHAEGKPCLDWTERRYHLGGPLGGLITQHLLSIRWVARSSNTRALRITPAGRAGFARLGVDAGVLRAC